MRIALITWTALAASAAFGQQFPEGAGKALTVEKCAGCHPAGSVIGCAGHNAAARVARDLGVA